MMLDKKIFINKKLKLEILYILINLIVIFEYKIYIYISIYLNKKYKVCLCTIGKKENKYVKEYIEHYKKYGVDKIFIFDNNEENDEDFKEVIYSYIKNQFVDIINYKGKDKMQIIAYNECYKKNYKKFDWFIFYDMDEFIYLDKCTNIKLFLNKSKFNKCQVIQLNWVMHTDNNFVRYFNKNLVERFPEKGPSLKNTIDFKSIIRGNILININSAHYGNSKLICCDSFGKIKDNFYINKKKNYKYNFIDHYFTKSTEEFLVKMKRGSVSYGKFFRYYLINSYFVINKITKEKIDYIENQTSIKLEKFTNKILNK